MDNILYIDDEEVNLKVFKVSFFEEYNIFTASTTHEAYEILCNNKIKVVITDQRMPNETGIDFINRVSSEFPYTIFMILSGYTDFDVASKAILNGHVYRFMLKPWKENEIRVDLNNAIEKHNIVKQNVELTANLSKQNAELKQLKQKLEQENIYLKEEIKIDKNFEHIITNNDNLKAILHNIKQVADSNASVLISGETGTGKELIARAVHNLSPRQNEPFIFVNCAAIPESLFESELFGHEKGAFTGATNQRKGKFEFADGGTIFLDEVGEIPLHLQSKLLRVLQESELERIGGSKTIKLNIRVISATNRLLDDEVKNDKFRSDLYYRLNVFPIKVPPLRERTDDIELLIKHFIAKFNVKLNKNIKQISRKGLIKLKLYDWPGNVRELENLVERAFIITNNNTLQIENLLPSSEPLTTNGSQTLMQVEKNHITTVLKKTGWRIGGENGTAKILGLNRTTLIARMSKLGIVKSDD